MRKKKDNSYGLNDQILSPLETLAQSIANIAPTATPTVVIPLVFAMSGNGTWLAYVIALVGILLVAANINQFSRHSASPGSLYTYIAAGLNPLVGVLAGWALLLAYIGTASAVTSGFTNYANVLLQPLTKFGDVPPVPLALLLTALVVGVSWLVAYKDIQLSARLMLVLELLSVSLIAVLVVLTLIKNGWHVDWQQFSLKGVTPNSLRLGLVLAIFSFAGFESATALGTEARHPLRTIPRAVVLSAVLVGALFIVSSYGLVLGFTGNAETLDQSAAPLNVLADHVGVGFLKPLVSLGAVVSFFACVLACINAGARILFLMGRHGLFHTAVGDAHADNKTPHVAVSIAAVFTFVPAAILIVFHVKPFDIYGWIGTVATYGFIITYMLISVAAPVYLYRRGQLTIKSIVIALGAIAFMAIALAGNLYPVPPAPYNWLPYLFLAYLGTGVLWYYILRISAPEVVLNIQHDLREIQERFAGDGAGI